MLTNLAKWHAALPDCTISANPRPDGSFVIIVKSADGKELRRVLPDDQKSADQLIRRVRLDLMMAKGQPPTREVIGTIDVSNLPTYTNGRLYKTRAASLWERRRLAFKASAT
ncbi:DUF3509 domain-containing protein [Pseudomonas sp. MYb185]|uniref:DUF3509 domain-containing protein n=1 Tax=Pseudomonas sp. MYb185 TaxID=1848729 RepID=UPI000CFBFAF1|nr:DUF3509 domain-containing protein [Pseudomonas sp. MYb185]PRB80443.1 hypothetical protein CQ007_12000 [Pseudomonas sp. MYb185]